jgi:hypothetical protein
MALAIGVCVCLAAYATAATEQAVIGAQSDNPPPKSVVAKDPKTGATVTHTKGANAAYTVEPPPRQAAADVPYSGTVTVNGRAEFQAVLLEKEAKGLLDKAEGLRKEAAALRNYKRPVIYGGSSTAVHWVNRTSEQQAEALLSKWKQAKESDREGIQKELRGVLTEDFKARLGKHQKEIEQLEAQLKQLRDKLNLRTSKQDEIVDFRLQQLLREAQGLGWGTDNKGTTSTSYFSGSFVPALPVPPAPPATPAINP